MPLTLEDRKLLITDLVQTLKYKKVFQANRWSMCKGCKNNIQVGEDFVFMGDKKMICMLCVEHFVTELEERGLDFDEYA